MFKPGSKLKVRCVSCTEMVEIQKGGPLLQVNSQVDGEGLSGFEDSLTVGKEYPGEVNASGGLMIVDDNGMSRNYGTGNFVAVS